MIYTWAVWQRNRLVGYVTAPSEWDAIRSANDKYGTGLYVERCLVSNKDKAPTLN